MKVGIDAIGFYVPHYYLDLVILAEARNVPVDKFYVGLGQRKMSVPPPDEDIVTMAANSAQRVLRNEEKSNIDTLMFATESGLDYAKAAGIYLHKLLELPSQCRVIELKQACYASTACIQMALSMLYQNPRRKILVIASDIARYGLNTSGEPSQGAGAVTMLLSAEPRLIAIEPESGFYTDDVMDFWRPYYRDEAIVNGKYSCDLYMRVLDKVWQSYNKLSGRQFVNHDYFCYHVPVPRLVEKAHKRLAKLACCEELTDMQLEQCVSNSLHYGRVIGNCYTAALYISLLSLLETMDKDLTNSRIGMYSYGAGCVGEFFSGVVQSAYRKMLDIKYHQNLLSNRQNLSYQEYEQFYNFKLPVDGSTVTIPKHRTGQFRLAAISNHKRIYECIS
ncbi:MAG: 3-hydroxy-3-methylglutaryl-CoA synthase [Coxiella sp. DG_40]|nr:MAG: 3-hydroxy-3-methylglutaryl-CoA synthase [Coxiella sp. DG_40]